MYEASRLLAQFRAAVLRALLSWGPQEGCGVKGLPKVMFLGSGTAAGCQGISAQREDLQVRKRVRPQKIGRASCRERV